METIYFRFIDFIGESKGFRFGSGTVVLFVLRKKAIVIVRAFIHQRGKKSSKRPVIHLQGGWPLLFTTVNDIRKKTRQPTREQKGNWQKTTQTFEYQTNISFIWTPERNKRPTWTHMKTAGSLPVSGSHKECHSFGCHSSLTSWFECSGWFKFYGRPHKKSLSFYSN